MRRHSWAALLLLLPLAFFGESITRLLQLSNRGL
jgi:hypothetical protein